MPPHFFSLKISRDDVQSTVLATFPGECALVERVQSKGYSREISSRFTVDFGYRRRVFCVDRFG
jgi:hypothetical protein